MLLDKHLGGRVSVKSVWTALDGFGRMHDRRACGEPRAGTPVVLVHGLGMSHRYMMPTLRALAPHVPVFAPDLPGFGKSDAPPETLDVQALASALSAWLAANNLQDAVLVGNSFGCQIIVDAVMRRLARPRALVLTAPTIDPAARTVREQLIRLLLDAPRERFSLVPLALREYFLTVGFSRAVQTLRYALADPIEDKLPNVPTPTLVVRGERDPLVPQGWAEEVTRLLPRARLVVLPRAAHAVNYDAPEELAECVLSFIGEVESRSVG